MDGDYLVLRGYLPKGATTTDTEKFVVSSAGDLTVAGSFKSVITAASGLTVSSGSLIVGASAVVASSAGALAVGPTTTAQFQVSSAGVLDQFRLHTTALSTAANATAVTLGATMSGRVIQIGGWASAARITLPAAAAGLNFLFSINRKGVGALSIAGAASGIMQVAESTGADAVLVSTARELNVGIWMYSDGTNWYTHVLPDGSTLMHAATAVAAILTASS
jgi:hypothetical protein